MALLNHNRRRSLRLHDMNPTQIKAYRFRGRIPITFEVSDTSISSPVEGGYELCRMLIELTGESESKNLSLLLNR